MEESDLTPRRYSAHIKANPNRARFGFGRKAASLNIDLQKADTRVDSLAHGTRTIVPEECVADKHEFPHFANLCDMLLKYAEVRYREATAGGS